MSNLLALEGNDSLNATITRNDISRIGFGPTPLLNQGPPILNQSPSTIQKPMNSNPNSTITLKLKPGLNFVSILKEYCDSSKVKMDWEWGNRTNE